MHAAGLRAPTGNARGNARRPVPRDARFHAPTGNARRPEMRRPAMHGARQCTPRPVTRADGQCTPPVHAGRPLPFVKRGHMGVSEDNRYIIEGL